MTDSSHKELLATKFFKKVMEPLAMELQARKKSFFPLGPDPHMESYFVEPTHRTMMSKDFELQAPESLSDFMTALTEFWIKEENAELAKIVPKLAKLAQELAHEEELSEDVSPFVYVMY